MTIAYWHFQAGDTLTLELYPLLSGGIANGAEGDAFTEPDGTRPGWYVATVAEDLTGLHLAKVLLDDVVLDMAIVDVTPTGTFLFGDPRNVLDGLPVTFASAGLAQLSGTKAINVTVPALVGNQLSAPLVRGDCYLHSHGRSIQFSREDFPDLAGDETVTLTAKMLDAPDPDDPPTITLTGSIAVAEGTKVIRFEPTSTQTASWTPGRYEFDVQVAFDGDNSATFVGPNCRLRVLGDLSLAS